MCLICRKVILEGEETKKLNRGGRRSVRHLACGKALASCPYIVDLTDSVETEAPAATRKEDLFPADSRGRKRSAPTTMQGAYAEEGISSHDRPTKR